MKPHAFGFAALALCASAAGASPEVTIELRPDAQASGAAVALGEIAYLSSQDFALVRGLVDLPIGRAPSAGQSVLVHRTVLAAWIRRRTAIAEAQIVWKGPDAARVATASQVIRGEAMVAVAQAALRERLSAQGSHGEVQVRMVPRDVDGPAGGLRLQARAPGQGALRQRMLVWVEVWVSGQFVRAVPVSLHVEGWRELPEAATPLEAGAPPADAMPAVQRGQWASLRSGAGAVLSEARVEVLQDGRLGGKVRVRQAGAKGGVIARVTGPGQVEVAR